MDTGKHIVVLDFGGQYAHLIARRVRQCGVYSEIRESDTPIEQLQDAAGIILSGGPQSVNEDSSPQGDPRMFDLGVPILGICFGLQWMVKTLGGEVHSGTVKEYGRAELRVVGEGSALQKDIPESSIVWMSHGDEAAVLPDGFSVTGTTDHCVHAMIAHEERNLFAMQFHPEVIHSAYGQQMISSFVSLCHADPWSINSYADYVGEEILHEVQDRNVFILVSGGVDSTVAFFLLNKVLGVDRVQGLFVDTGLMRKDEGKEIYTAFQELGITNLHIEDASQEFLRNLEGVYDPEHKRAVIGKTFLDVQKRVSEEMGLRADEGWLLGQGTIYPDTIETGATKNADTIKTHHNRVPEIQKMIDAGLVVEPLKELYKDEVRQLGEELGLPANLVHRHPFPGPGLGVRILCAEKESPCSVALDCPVSHVVLPVRSVGVQGDGRSYRHAVALFINDRHADALCWDLATSIPNASSAINRVLLCLSHKQPPEIVFSPAYITSDRAELLREADAIVTDLLRTHGLYDRIWQFPVVLLPIGTVEGGQSIVLRPVESLEAMTANAADLPQDVLSLMTEKLLGLQGIDMVFHDLTHKPPATIEWE